MNTDNPGFRDLPTIVLTSNGGQTPPNQKLGAEFKVHPRGNIAGMPTWPLLLLLSSEPGQAGVTAAAAGGFYRSESHTHTGEPGPRSVLSDFFPSIHGWSERCQRRFQQCADFASSINDGVLAQWTFPSQGIRAARLQTRGKFLHLNY